MERTKKLDEIYETTVSKTWTLRQERTAVLREGKRRWQTPHSAQLSAWRVLPGCCAERGPGGAQQPPDVRRHSWKAREAQGNESCQVQALGSRNTVERAPVPQVAASKSSAGGETI